MGPEPSRVRCSWAYLVAAPQPEYNRPRWTDYGVQDDRRPPVRVLRHWPSRVSKCWHLPQQTSRGLLPQTPATANPDAAVENNCARCGRGNGSAFPETARRMVAAEDYRQAHAASQAKAYATG